MTDWQAFVLEHGCYVRSPHLAAIVGQPIDAIEQFRRRVRPKRGTHRTFPDLFAMWHGRPPADADWPVPRKTGGGYEWLAPEHALLARLVGTLGMPEICTTLTTRLRALTGDPDATRNRHAVLPQLARIGLQMSDVVGGITITQAAREIGTRAIINHEIRTGKLPAFRAGRYHVITREAWAAWKAKRVFPPAGFVRLASLKAPLGIKSDKLSEWARLGYVPSAVRCSPTGTKHHSTQFGTWYLDPKVARKLLADRRAGRPMPWWRKPEPFNLRVTWRRYQRRRHPEACDTCRDIWGPAGAPVTWDDYVRRYPPLAFGAKRHLTRVWTPGLTMAALAKETGAAVTTVQRAISGGVLRARRHHGRLYVTRTDATRWKARRCPSGGSFRSWLSVRTACRAYGFTRAELLRHVRDGRLRLKHGQHGAARDVDYVLKQQVRELRDAVGYSAREAARRVGVSIPRLRVLLRGLEWRSADRIPHDVVNAAIKRRDSENGAPLAEVARILGKPLAWIRQEILAGTIRPLRVPWDKRRLYVTLPMFERLMDAALQPRRRPRWSADWLHLSDAADLARVSAATVIRWADARELKRRRSRTGWRYHRRSVIARARTYWAWASKRYKRAVPPAWLQAESAA